MPVRGARPVPTHADSEKSSDSHLLSFALQDALPVCLLASSAGLRYECQLGRYSLTCLIYRRRNTCARILDDIDNWYSFHFLHHRDFVFQIDSIASQVGGLFHSYEEAPYRVDAKHTVSTSSGFLFLNWWKGTRCSAWLHNLYCFFLSIFR